MSNVEQSLKNLPLKGISYIENSRNVMVLPDFYEYVPESRVLDFGNRLGFYKSRFECEHIGFVSRFCGGCQAQVAQPLMKSGDLHPVHSGKKAGRWRSRQIDKLLWLRDQGASHVIKLTLTFPKSFSLTGYSDLGSVRKIVFRFMDILERSMFSGFRLGAVYNIHIWSSEHPFDQHVHVHLTIPNVFSISKRKGRKVDWNKFYRFPQFFDAEQLDEIRDCWKSALHGAAVDVDGDVNAHSNYIRLPSKKQGDSARLVGMAKLIHWLEYSSRLPSVDVWKNGLAEDEEYNQFIAGDKDLGFIKHLLAVYKNRGYQYGFMYDLGARGYIKPAKGSIKHPCPFCNHELGPPSFVSSFLDLPDDVVVMQRTRKGFMFKPPPDWLKC